MGSYQVHSEARGPHWIAWVSRDGSGKPDRSVVVVGATREWVCPDCDYFEEADEDV